MSPRPPVCPACHTPLEREVVRNPPFDCPHCGVKLGFSQLYLLGWFVAGFVISLLVVQYLGLKAYAALLWLPILALCLIYSVPLMGYLGSPLRIQSAGASSYRNTVRMFFIFWIGCILFAVVYGSFIGAVPFLLGAPRQDAVQATDIFSLPLGLVNPRFMIRPDKSLAEVLGIITANSYFVALALVAIFTVVHGFIRRSRVTQLGISRPTLNDDDDPFSPE